MERLINPPQFGGIPYINQDFINILQESNFLSYKSFMEEINDTSDTGNNGIIIKGVRNVTPVGTLNVTYFDFTNSMIYLNGDFLEPMDFLSSQSNYEILATKFYLYEVMTEEKREKKVSGFSETVLNKRYFDIKTDTPTGGQSYIEIEIKNDKNLCQRYLDRILRYYIAEWGQVHMTLNKDYFDDDGVGFGEMFGFHFCDGRPKNNGEAATVQGSDTFRFRSREHFLIGYEIPNDFGGLSVTSPSSIDTAGDPTSVATRNYGRLRNTGGQNTVKLETLHIPLHNHGGITAQANNSLRHNHELQYGLWQNFQPAQLGKYFARSKKINNAEPGGLQGSFRKFFTVGNYSGFYPPHNYEAIRDQNTGLWDHKIDSHFSNSQPIQISPDLGDHTHILPNVVGGVPHNNLPAYCWVYHYEKMNPYV